MSVKYEIIQNIEKFSTYELDDMLLSEKDDQNTI